MSWLPGLQIYREDPLAAVRDLCNGLAIGVVFWPLVIGHAVLAKVPAFVSINTSISSPFVYLALGSLPLLSVQSGSTAALCLGELIESRFEEGDQVDHVTAAMASMMAALVGAMHFALGILDLAAIVELFSQPLLRARTGAAALVVILAQAEVLFAVKLEEKPSSPLVRFWKTCVALPQQVHWPAFLLSSCLLVLLIFCKMLGRCNAVGKKPLDEVPRQGCYGCCCKTVRLVFQSLHAAGNLIVLIVAGAVSQSFTDIGVLADFEEPRPRWSFAHWNLEQMSSALPTAVLTAFLSLGSHLTVAQRVRRENDPWMPRRELLALGGSSMVAASIGGMPVMANLAVCQALQGNHGFMATIGNILGHLGAFFLVAKLSLKIPRCAVAVILLVEFAPLFRTLPAELRHLYGHARSNVARGHAQAAKPIRFFEVFVASDLGIYLMAFFSPLIFGIVTGSVIAILFQVLVSISRFAGPGFVHIGRIPGTNTYDELVPDSAVAPIPKINITRAIGPRWFGNAAANTRAARADRQKLNREILVAIVDWSMVPFLDDTALAHYKESWSKVDVKVVVTNACGNVRRQIKDSGLGDLLEQPEETLMDLHSAVLWAEEYIRQVESGRTVIGVRERSAVAFDE